MRNLPIPKILLLLPLIFPTMVSAQVLDFPLAVQEQNQWCWAAATNSILQYYRNPQSQCKIAEYTRTVATWHDFGAESCCVDPGEGCNYPNYFWGYTGSLQDILTHWGVHNYGVESPLSLLQVQTEIDAGRPFVIRWGWQAGGGHFIVGFGIVDSTLYYMNPWPGEGLKIGDYDWVVSNGIHTWTSSGKIISQPRLGPFSSLDLTLDAGGAARAATISNDSQTHTGYATVDMNSGAAPYGTAVFSYKKDGVTVSEAGVPISPPTKSARIFIDYRSQVAIVPQPDAGLVDINTGIAIANPGAIDADVTFTLRDLDGLPLSSGHGTVAPGIHFAKFIDQLKETAPDFDLPPNFPDSTQFATLEISSSQSLSILALRMTTNQRHEVLFTTTPVADLSQAPGHSQAYFPQFADGGGYSTALLLLNTSDQTETGSLQFLDDNGLPMIVASAVGGAAKSSFGYSIPAGGAYRFQSDATSTTTKVGWVQATPDSNTSTPVGSEVFSYNPESFLITESGVPSATPTTHAHIYVDLSGGHNTGLALANPSDSSASISIKAFQADGVMETGRNMGPILLQANGHSAQFADQMIAGLPAGFSGMLDVNSDKPIAALTLRSMDNERRDFLMTAFPIADQNQSAVWPIVFPQIAEGDGYITQFNMLSSGEPAGLVIHFHDNEGAPLAIGK